MSKVDALDPEDFVRTMLAPTAMLREDMIGVDRDGVISEIVRQ